MDEDIFEVEKILSQRIVHSKKEYLIRWKGFGPEEDSWEPRKNLIGCNEILKEFQRLAEATKSTNLPAAKNYSEFTKVQTPRKRSRKPPEKDEKTPFKILHQKSQPPSSLTDKVFETTSQSCPASLNVKKKGSAVMVILAMLAFVLIILASRFPGVVSTYKNFASFI